MLENPLKQGEKLLLQVCTNVKIMVVSHERRVS